MSIESSVWDGSVATLAWGYSFNGVDSEVDRTTGVRASFAYFAGVNPATTPGGLPRFGSPSRRRMVVLQGVAGALDSSGNALPQWRILHNSAVPNGYNTSENTDFLAAVNSVFPAPAAQTYDAWKVAENIPAAVSGPFQDADGDGDENIKEFYFFTSPTDANSNSEPVFAPVPIVAPTGYSFVFNRAKDIVGVNMRLLVSTNLVDWDEVTLTGTNTDVVDMTTHEEVTITLPLDSGNKFYRIELTEAAG